jgi:parallel beta-helix repeat protein
VAGDYVVVLTAFNESYPAGVSATLTMHIAQPVHYVALDSSTPVPPYSSWATAATNIQDAVDAATVPGALVLVSNGVYQTSGRTVNGYALTNRVAVTKPLVLQSVNGPAVTIIQGYRDPVTTNGDSAVRCVYLTNLATLAGFTLTHGATRTNGDVYQEQAGGGVFGFSFAAMVSNCVLTGNSAVRGGGVISNTLYNCIIVSNSSSSGGGGAYHSTLNNCTLSGNTGYGVYYSTLNNCTLAGNYRGASFCTLSNCIVYYNDMGLGYPNYQNCTLNYCCTTPKPGGTGNITNAPLFVDQAGGNLRLQTNAPCINAGNNAYVTTTTDLDGRPRIVGGTVDIGAYEFQGAGMGEFIGWLQQYGLPTDGSADYLDADGDGMNNWQEWLCETDPTNALSVLQMLAPSGDVTGVTVTWQSVTDRTYFLERATNLRAQPPFSTLATNLTGQPVTTSYADTNAVGPGPFFYRVGVQQ